MHHPNDFERRFRAYANAVRSSLSQHVHLLRVGSRHSQDVQILAKYWPVGEDSEVEVTDGKDETQPEIGLRDRRQA